MKASSIGPWRSWLLRRPSAGAGPTFQASPSLWNWQRKERSDFGRGSSTVPSSITASNSVASVLHQPAGTSIVRALTFSVVISRKGSSPKLAWASAGFQCSPRASIVSQFMRLYLSVGVAIVTDSGIFNRPRSATLARRASTSRAESG